MLTLYPSLAALQSAIWMPISKITPYPSSPPNIIFGKDPFVVSLTCWYFPYHNPKGFIGEAVIKPEVKLLKCTFIQ